MKGSITVFMSLCLSVCILLIGTALESARLLLIRNQVSKGTEAAMDSLFAGYDGDLLDEFGILLLNTADLSGFNSIEELVGGYLEQELDTGAGRFLIGGNFFQCEITDVQTVASSSAVSMNGELFARSVLDYMKYKTAVNLIETVQKELELLEQGENVRQDTEEREKESRQEEVLEEGETVYDQERYEELVEESILGKIRSIRKNGFLELILPSERVLSEKTTSKSGFPSNYYSGKSEGAFGLLADMGDNILYGEYLLAYFDSFTDAEGNDALQYELEYILFGNGSDRKNIEEAIRRLLLLREGMNIMTIYRTPDLEAQADAFAAALVGWTGFVPLIEAVKAAVTGAWAYGESIIDVRTLLGGHKVPLLKSREEWMLSLDAVVDLIEGRYLGITECEEGMLYPDYLRLLLLLMDEQPKYYRTMDMIQCRLGGYKPRFYLKECMYAVQIQVGIKVKPLFPGLTGGGNRYRDAYEMHISAARMY